MFSKYALELREVGGDIRDNTNPSKIPAFLFGEMIPSSLPQVLEIFPLNWDPSEKTYCGVEGIKSSYC